MKILYNKNIGERSLIYLIQIMLLQFEHVNAGDAPKASYNNNTAISPLDVNYGYLALNSAVNEVNIRMLFNENVKANQMILYVIVMKTYQFARRKAEIEWSNSSIWAIITHTENVTTQTASIDASRLSTKPHSIHFNLEHTFYLRVKINCSDNLSLVVNGSQNTQKYFTYQIERPNFTWCTDMLRAGGLVLFLLSPTILYIMYRILREWHDWKIRIKKNKEQNRRFILYILPEESIQISSVVT